MRKELKEIVTDGRTLAALDHLYGIEPWAELEQLDSEKLRKVLEWRTVWWYGGEEVLCIFGRDVQDSYDLSRVIEAIGATRETRLVGYAEGELLIVQLGFAERVKGWL